MTGEATTNNTTTNIPWSSGGDIQVKIQSLTRPVATHQIRLEHVLDDQGQVSFVKLHDCIVQLVTTADAVTNATTEEEKEEAALDLNLSLCYWSPQGDLLPLTSQEDFLQATTTRISNSSGGESRTVLYVLAQVLQHAPQYHHQHQTHQQTQPQPTIVNTNASLEERLARMEDLLLTLVKSSSSSGGSGTNIELDNPDAPARCREYKSRVKEQQAIILSKLGQVPSVPSNNISTLARRTSATTTPTPVALGATATATTDTDTTVTLPPPLAESASASTSTDNASVLLLQDFLQRLVREREKDMQQLLTVKTKERKESAQTMVDLKNTIHRAMMELEHKLHVTLEEKLSQHKEQFQQHIRKFELQQLAKSLGGSTMTSTSTTPESTGTSSNVALSAIVEQKLDKIQQRLENIEQHHNNNNNMQQSTPPTNTVSQQDLARFQKQMESTLQTRMNLLDQRLVAVTSHNNNTTMSSLSAQELQTKWHEFQQQMEEILQNNMTTMEQRLVQVLTTTTLEKSNTASTSDNSLDHSDLESWKSQVLMGMTNLEQQLKIVASQVAMCIATHDGNSIHNQLESFKNQFKNVLLIRLNVMEQRLNTFASSYHYKDSSHHQGTSPSCITIKDIDNIHHQLESFKNQLKNLLLIRLNMIEQRLNTFASSCPGNNNSPQNSLSSVANNDNESIHNQLESFKNQLKNLLLIRLNMIEQRFNTFASSCPGNNNNQQNSLSSVANNDNDSIHHQLESFKNQLKNLLLIRLNMIEQRFNTFASSYPGNNKSPLNSFSNIANNESDSIHHQLETFKNQLKNLLLIRLNMIEQRFNTFASSCPGKDSSNHQGTSSCLTIQDIDSIHNQLESFKNQLKNLLLIRLNMIEQRFNTFASSCSCKDKSPQNSFTNHQLTSSSSSPNAASISEQQMFLDSFKQQIDDFIQSQKNLPQRVSACDDSFNFQEQMDALKTQLNHTIQIRMNILEQRVLQHIPSTFTSDIQTQVANIQEQLNNTIQIRMNLLEQKMMDNFNVKVQTTSTSSSNDVAVSSCINDIDRKLDSFKMQMDSLIQIRLNLMEQRLVKSDASNPIQTGLSAVTSKALLAASSSTFTNLDEKLDRFKAQIDALLQVRMNLIEQRNTSSASFASVSSEAMLPTLVDTNNQLHVLMAKLDTMIRASSSPLSVEEVDVKLQGLAQKLDHVMQIRMNLMEQRLQTLVQVPQTNSTHSSCINLEDFLHRFEKEMGNRIQVGLKTLEQKMEVPSRPDDMTISASQSPNGAVSPSRTSVSNGISGIPEMARTMTTLVQQLMETFRQKIHALDTKLTTTIIHSYEKMHASQSKSFKTLSMHVTEMVRESQLTILKNEKLYASALRQTMVRLHKETHAHSIMPSPSDATVFGSNEREIVVSTSRGTAPPTPDGISAMSWEAIKDAILSCRDELRMTQQQRFAEQENSLVECIERAQRTILSKLRSNTVGASALDESISEMEERLSTRVQQIQAQATATILDRMDQQAQLKNLWRRPPQQNFNDTSDQEVESPWATAILSPANTTVPTSPNSGFAGTSGSGVVTGLTTEEVEDIIHSAVDKLERAVEGNCEQIQAQTTALVLDKVEKCQNILISETERSQSIVLDRVTYVEGFVTRKLDSTIALLQALQAGMDKIHVTVEERQTPIQNNGRAHAEMSSHLTPPLTAGLGIENQPREVLGLDSRLTGSRFCEQGALTNNLNSLELPLGRKQRHASPEPITYQRFLEMESRAHQLEHAYDCIRSNRPVERLRETA